MESKRKNINNAMVYTYFEIGRMIVEEEQEGKKKMLSELNWCDSVAPIQLV